jgi:hypothetical protein
LQRALLPCCAITATIPCGITTSWVYMNVEGGLHVPALPPLTCSPLATRNAVLRCTLLELLVGAEGLEGDPSAPGVLEEGATPMDTARWHASIPPGIGPVLTGLAQLDASRRLSVEAAAGQVGALPL